MRTPQQVADEWAARMQASQQKISDGIDSVQESPTAKAAQSLDKYLQRVADAVNSGKMAARLNGVSLASWKAAAKAKVSRVGAGALEAKPKMVSFLTQWLPFVRSVRDQVRAMPSTTVAERDARMQANVNLLRQFKRS